MKRRDRIRREGFAIATVVLTVVIHECRFPFLDRIFVVPSGILAGWLVGAATAVESVRVSFVSAGGLFAVTPACSGVGFFGLVLAVAFHAGFTWRILIAAVPAIYCFAVACNVLRISAWVVAFPIVEAVLPENSLHLIHELFGALVYLPVLTMAYLFFRSRVVRSRSPDPAPTMSVEPSSPEPFR